MRCAGLCGLPGGTFRVACRNRNLFALTKRETIDDAAADGILTTGRAARVRADLERARPRSIQVSPGAYVSLAVTTVSRCTLADLLWGSGRTQSTFERQCIRRAPRGLG